MINQHDKARLHCIHYGGRRSGKSQMMKRAAVMHNFREAMREAFKAGLEHGVDTQGAFTDADEAGFTAFFQEFVAKVTKVPVEAVKAYEEPIRLTPTVELPGPKIEDVLHEIEQAFAVPRELFGMDGARGGRMTSKDPNFTEYPQTIGRGLRLPQAGDAVIVRGILKDAGVVGEVTTDLADDSMNIKRDVSDAQEDEQAIDDAMRREDD